MPENHIPRNFQLEIEVEQTKEREVVAALLHTILFHRLIGAVKPKEVFLDSFDITYVKCEDSLIDRKVEKSIREAFEHAQGNQTILQVIFSGYFGNEDNCNSDGRSVGVGGKKGGWMSILGGSASDDAEWEIWTIRITIRSINEFSTEEDCLRFNQVLAKNLQGCLLYISNMSFEYREHLPRGGRRRNNRQQQQLCIPCNPQFKIVNPQINGQCGTDSWSSVLKKIISDTASLNYR